MSNHLIASKAINSYRRRDIIAYLSLRYYLDSTASRKDIWAKEVAVLLSINNPKLNYLKVKNFKSIVNNKIVQRELFIPAANEIIAESALIDECSKHPAFNSHKSVYSYLLVSATNTSTFRHYLQGWKMRYKSIKSVCEANPDLQVKYFDIKSFYPSISLELASDIWLQCCSGSEIDDSIKVLGIQFLKKYEELQNDSEKKGLVVGPMFSHLIGNLVLQEVDIAMDLLTKCKYWRYVDDIVVIGDSDEIEVYSQELKKALGIINLELHDEIKTFCISTQEWLSNSISISQDLSGRWPRFIGHIKEISFSNLNEIEVINQKFSEFGIRIEIPKTPQEFSSISFMKSMIRKFNSFSGSRKVTIQEIIVEASILKAHYKEQFETNVDKKIENELGQKSHNTLLKYLVGRLIYLATEEELTLINTKISDNPDLKFHYEIINSLLTLDVTMILKMGSNAAQASAQIIKLKSKTVYCGLTELNEFEIQGLSIFKFHGITIEFNGETQIDDALFKFASGDIQAGKETDNQFIYEFSALHGHHESRHEETLNSVFDKNESFSFDALESGYGYSN
jgi:ribosome-associated toxin RatA of RatAB toxin-antitoxin module